MAGWVLQERIATPAFLSNFNLSKKFRTFDFRVWILLLQIYNFISVWQSQIRENVDKLIMLKVIFWQVITVSFQDSNYWWGVKLPEKFWQDKFNITYYKQNLVTNNEFCCFYQNISANSITSIISFNKQWPTLLRVNHKHWPWSLLRCEDFLSLYIIFDSVR